jgi:hypothetical protein
MNRHLGLLAATTKKVKYDTRGCVYNKAILKEKSNNIDMEEVIKTWEDTKDKHATLRKLGKLFKNINESHEKDLIKL